MRKSTMVGDRETAEKVARAMREKIKRGEWNLGGQETATFGKYAEQWLREYVSTLRESTYEKYEGFLRLHILPALEKQKLDQITKGTVKSLLLAKKKEGYSRQSLADILSIVNNVFEYANDQGDLELEAPTKKLLKQIKAGKKRRDLDPSEVYTEDESSVFLEACPGEWYPFFLMALRTGLRLGELLALRWADVSIRQRAIWVRRSYRRVEVYAPKDEDRRKVDMSEQLADALKGWRLRQKEEGMRLGLGHEHKLVFHNEGRLYEQYQVRRAFDKMQRKADLRRIKFHGLRHTFATLLLLKGAPIQYVSKQLGHSDVETTFRHYIHWIEQAKEKAEVNLLDAPECTLSAPSASEMPSKEVTARICRDTDSSPKRISLSGPLPMVMRSFSRSKDLPFSGPPKIPSLAMADSLFLLNSR